MRLPIQYALSYPERCEGVARKMNWNESFQLDFEPPDTDRFPALLLGHEAAKNGGTTGAVLNAANETAVQGFLDGQIKFNEIVPACRAVLDHHQFDAQPSLEELLEIDAWARLRQWSQHDGGIFAQCWVSCATRKPAIGE